MKKLNNISSILGLFMLILIIGLNSCKEDTIGPIFDDLAYFVNEKMSLNVKSDANILKVPITHRNHANNGKVAFNVDVAEGTTASLYTLGTYEADFTNSDTVWIDVEFTHGQLVDDVPYTIYLTIEEGDGYLQPMLFDDGNDVCEVAFTKFIPFSATNFEASYTAIGVSDFTGEDVIFDVTVAYLGPDDNDPTIHLYAINNFYNVEGASALIGLNTTDNTLSCASQYFKDDYLAVYNDATGSFMNSGSSFKIGEIELVDFSVGAYLDIFSEGITFTKIP